MTLYGDINYQAIFIGNLFFLFTVLLIMGVASFILETYARNNFWQKQKIILERERIIIKNKKISQQNEKLELQSIDLEELYATRNKLFSVIAHDLRTPFNSLLGFSDLLIESCNKNELDRVKEFGQYIHTISTNTFDLLTNLLDWSRFQTGKLVLHKSNFNLKKVIDECVLFATEIADRKGIILNSTLIEDKYIDADNNMVNTILRNLISNAIKFSFPKGIVRINVEESIDTIIVSVIDNGIGMSTENATKLFGVNSKNIKSGTNNENGTGLGLLLCNEFVRLHQGRIWVESELGIGSKFYFSLSKSS